jgi:hypothetical protein
MAAGLHLQETPTVVIRHRNKYRTRGSNAQERQRVTRHFLYSWHPFMVMGKTTRKRPQKIHITPKQAVDLLLPYVKDRLIAQIKSVWLIILYLVFFQTLILNIRIFEASVIAVGIALVVVGLTLFMEGLFLGLMRLGSLVGSGLPRKSPILVVLGFALLLGFLATLAEPSIQVLQMAGKSVKPWEAPLLFLLLNKYSHYLVYAVGGGVGMAVGLGMFRFYYNISLKPFIYFFVGALVLLTVWASFDPNMKHIIGLAWDCGAVTTGPVTVPLVLALGIGVSRMVGTAETGVTGFGVVTLASLLPVVSVLILGIFFSMSVPDPMDQKKFFEYENRWHAETLFTDRAAFTRYVLTHAGPDVRTSFFKGDSEKITRYLEELAESDPEGDAVSGDETVLEWLAAIKRNDPQKAALSGGIEHMEGSVPGGPDETINGNPVRELIKKNFGAALKAIGLLTIPIFLILFLLIRETLPYPDEIVLGIVLCVLGLATFSMGIELGLDKLGTQVGSKLPSCFKAIPVPEGNQTIVEFDPDLLQTAVSEDGNTHRFFFIEKGREIIPIPYDPAGFDQQTRQYHYSPVKGPLFGAGSPLPGIMVVILFAFIMGYGATLAEPALNALGVTVEEVTAGTFKKSSLMQAVAVGVGSGIALGVAKIILHIPIVWILAPSYVLLILVTKLSTEEFVNIGWDSAGVTTGPITVPLVLAMGLGIGSQVGVVEGFGILASASVFPILSVLLLGLHINRKRKSSLIEAAGNGNRSRKENA